MNRSRPKLTFCLLPVALAFAGLAGCDDSARKPIQAHTIQIAPPSQPAALAPLPVNSRGPAAVSAGEIAPQAPNGIDLLVAQSEAAFDAGEVDFHAGHLGEAREEFDESLDVLLSSGFEIEADPRLNDLYHRIVESVHTDELQAFRQGDGFGEQESTPAPIDEIAEGAVPQPGIIDPNLVKSVQGEVNAEAHDVPITVNEHVLQFVNYFQTPRGSAIVETGLRRAGQYREMVGRVLREEGMPQDLIYLAQAESAFQPQAVSKAGARGMWQFMSFAGHKYGLQKSWWVDERQDPEKATRAAAHDLRDLYDQFGDWYLAMAAYNSGAGAVQHAIERTGYADFWELYKRNALPKETRNYVPIILALTIISKDPAHYGVHFDPEPPLKTDAVKPGQPIDLRLVAETIDTDLDTLRALNPQLLRLVTPADPEFVLQLPEGSAERFFAEIAAIPPEKWVSWRRHKVEQGETLSAIAKSYHVLPAEIADANDLPAHAELEEGQKLIIPAAARSEEATGKLVRYQVRRADTMASIADEFDVATTELRKWNRLKSDHVVRGMRLKIYPGGMSPAPQTEARASVAGAPGVKNASSTARRSAAANAPVIEARSAAPVIHHVKSGETLWSIARAYQTTVEAIRNGNAYLFSRPLQVGDTLTILASH
jgi:membrane-bound lytic murein transglycosylase D